MLKPVSVVLVNPACNVASSDGFYEVLTPVHYRAENWQPLFLTL